jgi:murein DD-endopeptidase MepM/ murein hydrolase activator NlpD
MNEKWDQDALLHLGDALAEDIANTSSDALLAEVAEDLGDRRALVKEFDTIFTRAVRQTRRQRIAARLKHFAAQALEWLVWKPVMAPLGTIAAVLLAIVVYEDRSGPPDVISDTPIVSSQVPDGASRRGSADDIRLTFRNKPSASRGSNDSSSFAWPVRGQVISSFEMRTASLTETQRDRTQNDGISIVVPEGTDVHAAADGVVSYVGDDKTFGNLVLVRHANDLSTGYGHASSVLVNVGDTIQSGQVIAKVGHTGNITESQLYFEVRKGPLPVDPMQYLSRD